MNHVLLPHPSSRRPGFAVPALFLAALQGDPPVFQTGNFVGTPEDVAAGPYGNIASGDLTHDWSPEVATIKGDELIVCTNPDTRDQAVVVDDKVLDVCFVPDSDGDSIPELLYTTSDDGLKRVQFNAAQDRYEVETVDGSAHWLGAKRIRWSPDVYMGEGVIFVGSNGRTFYRCAAGAGSDFAEPDELFTLAMPINPLAEALDVVLLEYDSTSDGQEILLRHAYGFQVRRQDGSVAVGRSGNWPYGNVAALRVTGESDSVAWVAQHPGGASSLVVFNAAYPAPQDPLPISTRTYGSIAAADIDADGDDDLVLGADHWPTLEVLVNVPNAAAWFTDGEGRMLDVDMSINGQTGMVSSMGKVLCANLYNEWTDDELPLPSFAIALPEAGGLRLMSQFESDLYDVVEEQTQFDFLAATFTSARLRDEGNCGTAPPTGTHSLWTTTLGNGWGITATATHVEMIVGKTESDEDPTVFEEETFALSDPTFDANGTVPGSVPRFDGLEEDASNLRYFVQVRPVKKNSSGDTLRVWRWSILGMCNTCPGYEWLLTLPGGKPKEVVLDLDICLVPDCSQEVPPGPEGTRYIPSAVPQSRIPGPGPGVFDWDDQ